MVDGLCAGMHNLKWMTGERMRGVEVRWRACQGQCDVGDVHPRHADSLTRSRGGTLR